MIIDLLAPDGIRRNPPKTPRDAFHPSGGPSHHRETRTQYTATARHWSRIWLYGVQSKRNR